MKTILGLSAPLGGEIIFGDGLHRDEIGYLPQQTLVQRDFPASVREIVLSGCGNRMGLRPFYSRDDKRLAAENMEKMGIADLAGRCYRELSGGQRAKVLLLKLGLTETDVLLLDEPTRNFSPLSGPEIRAMFRAFPGAILAVSHDRKFISEVCDRVLRLTENGLEEDRAGY
jgi:zinc transport system ATP-binding protein